jgi:ADP-heptose:LPS heptosyltransferase
MRSIVVAPFANGDVRDWQADHYARLIGLLIERWSGAVRVVGSASQRLAANGIVRALPATQVSNDCGMLGWDAVVAEVRAAACVIGNNSGITHLSGHMGVPTVCVFGGSHRRTEWRPLGAHVRTLSSAIGCAPCHIHRAADCPYDKACLARIAPETVAETVFGLIGLRAEEEVADGV